MLRAGIVGLPNVGKSTLFNALTAQASALAANYPFATIEPNVGVVRGASKGEGLGNQFLANIRETDAVIHVVRCFEDENVHHVEGTVDPRRDIDTIQVELALADLSTVERRREKAQKAAKGGDKTAKLEIEVADKLLAVLAEGKPARTAELDDDERAVARGFFLLTSKPTIYAANVDEATLADPESNPHVRAVHEIASAEAAEYVPICAQLEAELVALAPEDRKGYLSELGVESSGVDRLIQSAYRLLGLMSFLTAGEKEVRAWTVPRGTRAPQAAGTIHSDIERGFIRAEIVSYDDLTRAGSYAAAREQGLLRLEGKEYVMQEGDVVHFRFNV